MFFYQGIDIGHLCMTLILHLNEAGQFPIDFFGTHCQQVWIHYLKISYQTGSFRMILATLFNHSKVSHFLLKKQEK
ncbi:hypothetical protein AT575_06495 [Streptococcus penaeicida]|uniref:Uncharacterized protein n=1 Tax=Streptococcus penaeicida TaxID=1765960 RepID=A0A2N8LBJ0_9STRE|nr:hypothetical protein AT575_06495 [Streptococcus penaeicida]